MCDGFGCKLSWCFLPAQTQTLAAWVPECTHEHILVFELFPKLDKKNPTWNKETTWKALGCGMTKLPTEHNHEERKWNKSHMIDLVERTCPQKTHAWCNRVLNHIVCISQWNLVSERTSFQRWSRIGYIFPGSGFADCGSREKIRRQRSCKRGIAACASGERRRVRRGGKIIEPTWKCVLARVYIFVMWWSMHELSKITSAMFWAQRDKRGNINHSRPCTRDPLSNTFQIEHTFTNRHHAESFSLHVNPFASAGAATIYHPYQREKENVALHTTTNYSYE